MTGTINSTTTPLAGTLIQVGLTRSGGTAWTGSPFALSSTSPSRSQILSQRLIDNATAVLTLYTGDFTGTVTIADSLNAPTYSFTTAATRTPRTVTGTQYYVSGGIAQPKAPNCIVGGTTGTTTRLYQVIAKNAAGATLGFTATNVGPLGNLNVSTYLWGPNILTVNTTNATLNGTNNVSLLWEAVPGATTSDLIRSSDGTTWVSMTGSLGLSGTTYTDIGATTASYVLPTSNTTALGSDSNNGTTSATPFATMSKAGSVAVSGDGISCSNVPCDSTQVLFAPGVIITGPATWYTTYAVTNKVAYSLPSHGDVSDIRFQTDNETTFLIGSHSTDPVVTDCYLYRCTGVSSQQHVFRVATTSFFHLYDCKFYSGHGTLGVTGTDCVVNFMGGLVQANDAPSLSGLTGLPVNIQAGFLLLRTVNVIGVNDKLMDIGGDGSIGIQIQANNANGCGLYMLNTSIFGQWKDIDIPNSTNLKTIVARNTPTSANIAAFVTSADVGTYIAEPISALTANDISSIFNATASNYTAPGTIGAKINSAATPN